jgi:hypothetical protein
MARQLALVRMLITKEPEMTRVYYDFWVQAAARSGPLQDSMRHELGRYRTHIKRTMLPESCPEDASETLAAVFLGLLEGPLLQLALDDAAFNSDEYLKIIERLMYAAVARVDAA